MDERPAWPDLTIDLLGWRADDGASYVSNTRPQNVLPYPIRLSSKKLIKPTVSFSIGPQSFC